MNFKPNLIDRAVMAVAPERGLKRMVSRAKTELFLTHVRHYEAAAAGRRTAGWSRASGDANAAIGPALAPLRTQARDLVRNNAWAKNALRVITRNVIGWGLMPKADEVDADVAKTIALLWKRWAATTECDADGRRTFYGIQRQATRTIAEAGEVLVRRRWRRSSDGLVIPVQFQVLEPDLLDTNREGKGQEGGRIVQGVEYDAIGRRTAYWLFDEHPGQRFTTAAASRRISARDIVHVFDDERIGAARGVTWFAPAVVNLRDFDEYEDATILRQRIAAMFAAFITNPDGDPENLIGAVQAQATGSGATGTGGTPRVEELYPGMVKYLAPGQKVEFSTPPLVANDGFTERTLRRIAAAMGVTYEDLTNDYSKVNYSSARMARLAHWLNVYDWQWNMLVPQLCDPLWAWAMEGAVAAGLLEYAPPAQWTASPMPMIDPDKEGLALSRLVRAGAMTHDEMVRERGYDPDTHWAAYAEGLKKLDKHGIVLDSDPRKTTASGQGQQPPAAGGAGEKDEDDPGEDE